MIMSHIQIEKDHVWIYASLGEIFHFTEILCGATIKSKQLIILVDALAFEIADPRNLHCGTFILLGSKFSKLFLVVGIAEVAQSGDK